MATEEKMALMAGDTDDIKGYVFESSRLPEIVGASAILDRLNRSSTEHCIKTRGGKVYFRGGGAFLAAVPAQSAPQIAADIQQAYVQTTGAATITIVWDDFANWPAGASFQDRFRHLSYRLRRAKEQKETVPFWPAVPPARRCDSCQMRPACNRKTHAGETLWLCPVCEWKWGFRDQHGHWLVGRLLSPLQQEFQRHVEAARSLEDVGNASRREGYIGLIYADGDGVGAKLLGLSSEAEYQGFSQGLDEATLRATYEDALMPLARCALQQRGTEVCPFQPLLIGGDDLLAITPAQYALPAAVALCEGFARRAPQGLTMSAGVVIAPHNYPVFHLEALAGQLLKSAKARARQEGCGAIDFWFLRGGNVFSTNLGQHRRKTLRRERGGSEYQLHERPYTVAEMKDLLQEAERLAEAIPPTQLYALRAELEKGRDHASLFYLRQMARWGEQSRRAMQGFEGRWFRQGGYPLAPWNRRGRGDEPVSTPLVDVIDLIDLMGKEASS